MFTQVIKEKNKCIYILHALPNVNTSFQWLIEDDVTHEVTPIEGQTYESITLTSNIIIKRGCNGKYLYCNCKDVEQYKTQKVKLYSDFETALQNNAFDTVESFDENGMIKKLLTECKK
jgi:hypothetical protein